MEINEKSYILGYWFASNGKDNWYMMVIREPDTKNWTAQMTFRYNKDDDDPFLDKDKKNIRTFIIDGNLSENLIIDKINLLFEEIKNEYNDFNDHFMVRGNTDKFLKIAKTKHYMHIKRAN